MKEGQEPIYCITADSLAAARSSPQLEIFRKKGIEVLLLVDRVDEWMLSHLYEFEGKPLQERGQGRGGPRPACRTRTRRSRPRPPPSNCKPLLERLKAALKDRAKDVRVTTRLVDSPACLVAEEGDMSGHLARLLKQAGQVRPEAPSRPIVSRSTRSTPLVKRLADRRRAFR